MSSGSAMGAIYQTRKGVELSDFVVGIVFRDPEAIAGDRLRRSLLLTQIVSKRPQLLPAAFEAVLVRRPLAGRIDAGFQPRAFDASRRFGAMNHTERSEPEKVISASAITQPGLRATLPIERRETGGNSLRPSRGESRGEGQRPRPRPFEAVERAGRSACRGVFHPSLSESSCFVLIPEIGIVS